MSSPPINEDQIFSAAIEFADEAERCAYLDEACGEDTQLRASVDELLAMHDTAGDFLDTPVLGRVDDGDDQQPGTTLGRYRLIERIGEGGFGVVWKAEQTEPVQREVALKIIKLGMDTRHIIARFEGERQALAMMSHANIATVLDAGSTERGRPYFVMELVTGHSIDDFCDEQRLPIGERLGLFAEVCRAVHHAHQKGIVHRDLKPSNILVASDEGRAVPKIIDFGIAKAMHWQLTRDETTTTARQLVGTPEYMSPEQITCDPDIDTRADVYALGGVLYKLLVGVGPLDTATHRQAGLDELARAIREDEPHRPSTRILKLDNAPSIASQRAVQPSALHRSLRGDLDWIVMKALEKDRTRRYESAADLARDLERHVACQPVSAGPPGVLYRAHKFVRRNRVSVLAASIVLFALVVGSVAATVGLVRADRARQYADRQWQRAEHERQAAEKQQALAVAEAEKALRVARMLEDMIGAAGPDQGHPADFTMRQQLDEFAASLGDELQNHPQVEARLRRTIGRLYLTLWEAKKAGPHLTRALELRRQVLTDDDPLTTQSEVDFAWYLYLTSRLKEAEQALAPVLVRLRNASPSNELVEALDMLSRIRDIQEDDDQRSTLSSEAWSVSQAVHGDEHPVTLTYQAHTALAILQSGELDEAEPLARDALERLLAVRPEEHVDVALAKYCLARVLRRRRDFTTAEQLVREAIQVHRKLIGEDNIFLVEDLATLAAILRGQGRRDEALEVARDAVDMAERRTVEGDRQRLKAYRKLVELGRAEEPTLAADAWAKAIATQRRLVPDHPQIQMRLRQRALLLRKLARWEEAAECYRDVLEILRKDPAKSRPIAVTLHALADMLREAGEPAKAETCLREAIAISDPEILSRPLFQIDHLQTLIELNRLEEAQQQAEALAAAATGDSPRELSAVAQTARAQILMAASDYGAAAESLRGAINQIRGQSANRRLLMWIHGILAQCNVQIRRFDDAEFTLLRTVSLVERQRYPPIYRRRAVRQLVDLYEAWDKPGEAARWREKLKP